MAIGSILLNVADAFALQRLVQGRRIAHLSAKHPLVELNELTNHLARNDPQLLANVQ